MSNSPIDLNSRTRKLPPIRIDRGHYPKPDDSSNSDISPNKYIAPTQKTEASSLVENSDSLVINSHSTFHFGPDNLIVEGSSEANHSEVPAEKKLSKVASMLNSLKDLAVMIPTLLLGENKTPEALNNKIQELLSKVFGEAPIKLQAEPSITSQDPEKVGGRPVMPNNVGHELPPASNAYAPENRSYGNQTDMHATPGAHPGNTAKYQPADAVSGSSIGHHGSAYNNILQFEIKNKAEDDIDDNIDDDIDDDIEPLTPTMVGGKTKAPPRSDTEYKTDD